MKVSLKALAWAACCLLLGASHAQAQEWTIGGWMNGGMMWNMNNPTDGFNGPVTFTDRANEFQMHQVNTFIERPTDTGGNGWDFGARVDLLWGSDYRFTTATGLEQNSDFTNNWNGEGHRFYGFALPQFYAEVAYNDLKTKVGHFYSPVGFFAVPATANFFNSLPYTFQYGEPFTHTGTLSTYQVTDNIAIGGGMIKGWDNFDNSFNPHVGLIDTQTLQLTDNISLALVHVWSQEASASPTAGGFSQRWLQTAVLSVNLTDRLQYVMHSDYGIQGNATATGGIAEWYGANQYLFYTVNDRFSFGVNFEWFRDLDGFRIVTVGAPTAYGSSRTAPLPGGWTGSFYQITAGPKWTPTENLTIRPNARIDWYDGAPGVGGAQPYNSNTDTTQMIFGTDAIITF